MVSYNDLNEHVKCFDRTFKCHPPTREEIIEILTSVLGVPPESVTEEAITYLERLHRMALFGTRLGLMVEEMGEWSGTVLKERPLEEQAKEFSDLVYSLQGTGDTMQIPLEGAGGGFERIIAKNQSKIDNAASMQICHTGKIIKPEDQ